MCHMFDAQQWTTDQCLHQIHSCSYLSLITCDNMYSRFVMSYCSTNCVNESWITLHIFIIKGCFTCCYTCSDLVVIFECIILFGLYKVHCSKVIESVSSSFILMLLFISSFNFSLVLGKMCLSTEKVQYSTVMGSLCSSTSFAWKYNIMLWDSTFYFRTWIYYKFSWVILQNCKTVLFRNCSYIKNLLLLSHFFFVCPSY